MSRSRLALLVSLLSVTMMVSVLAQQPPHPGDPTQPTSPLVEHHHSEFDCGFEEISAGFAETLAALRRGEVQFKAPPTVGPGRPGLRSGGPPVVTRDDLFPYEDTAGLLSTNFTSAELIQLMVTAANSLMVQHCDSFDFIGFWLNFDAHHTIGAAFYKRVENDVAGIGDVGIGLGEPPLFNLRPNLGLAGDNVEGFIMMWNINSSFWQPGTASNADFTRLALGQEFEHRFAQFLPPLLDGRDLQGDNASCGRQLHWNWQVDGQGSCMEISEWVGSNPAILQGNFVTFNTDIPGSVFSYTDLYLMGYVTAAEMDAGNSELRFMDNSTCGGNYNGSISTFDSSDIIASAGPRVPSAATEDRDYRTGWIMFHRPGLPPTMPELQKAASILTQHGIDWSTSTLGRGNMDNTLPDAPPFALDAQPAVASAGDTVTFTTCGGEPGNLALLFIVGLNGSPFVRLVTSSPLDAAGSWVTGGTVPNDPNLPGNDLSFRTFSLDALGNIQQTNEETVSFP